MLLARHRCRIDCRHRQIALHTAGIIQCTRVYDLVDILARIGRENPIGCPLCIRSGQIDLAVVADVEQSGVLATVERLLLDL